MLLNLETTVLLRSACDHPLPSYSLNIAACRKHVCDKSGEATAMGHSARSKACQFLEKAAFSLEISRLI